MFNTIIERSRPHCERLYNKIEPHIPKSVKEGDLVTKICAGWCAANALEMGVRAAVNIGSIFSKEGFYSYSSLQDKFSRDLAGALLSGACALNIVPGSAKTCGILTFLFAREDYIVQSQARHFNVEILSPICKHILSPLVELAYKVASRLFSLFGGRIPMNPTWGFIGLLSIAFVTYKYYQSFPKPIVPELSCVCPNCNHQFRVLDRSRENQNGRLNDQPIG